MLDTKWELYGVPIKEKMNYFFIFFLLGLPINQTMEQNSNTRNIVFLIKVLRIMPKM